MDKHILLVEDHQDILEMYSRELESYGYVVDGVNTGDDALEKVSHNTYDLLLLDIMLPDMDGVALLRQMREGKIGEDVLVYMLTVLEDEKIAIEAAEAGASGYFKKSEYPPVELAEEIRKILPNT